jgi:CPA2 family monovalent cation:H+ antiporter-2
LSQNSQGLRYLAEFGVVFLMFVIGLEFSLPRLKAMKRHVFGLGLSQVVLTVLITASASLALGWLLPQWWKMSWQMAIALGGVMAMSSTAIVIKLVAERLEIESEHGKRVVGILLFQDLAVVPLLVLIPALGADPDDLLWAVGLATIKATVLLAVLLTGGQTVMRWWLTRVARYKSDELFMLNLLLITLGLAWLTEHAGLSLALGAFVAGMLISETEFKHQVETDIRPFHDVLLGLFFITIGMMLDWRLVLERCEPLALLEALGERGCNQVLWECGPELATAALRQGCVQQLAAVLAPKLLGGINARTPLADLGLSEVNQAELWQHTRLQQLGDDYLLQLQPQFSSSSSTSRAV